MSKRLQGAVRDQLRAAREGAGLSCSVLGAATGMDSSAISRAESGRVVPGSPHLVRVARATGYTFTIGPESLTDEEVAVTPKPKAKAEPRPRARRAPR